MSTESGPGNGNGGEGVDVGDGGGGPDHADQNGSRTDDSGQRESGY